MNGLLGQGFVLMTLGMVVVFVFLTILFLAMQASAWFFIKYAHLFPEDKPAESPLKKISSNHAEIALAIAVAHTKTTKK